MLTIITNIAYSTLLHSFNYSRRLQK